MVRLTIWEKRYNSTYDYTEQNLKSRETLKLDELADKVNPQLTNITSCYVIGKHTNPELYIHTDELCLMVKCTIKQYKKVVECLNVNDIEERSWY